MTVFAGVNFNDIFAVEDNQVLFGTLMDDFIVALGGDNVVYADEGTINVVLTGVDYSNSETVLLAFDRPDAGDNTIFGGSGRDIVATGRGNDVIFAGEGDNQVFDFFGGDDTVYAGWGNDLIQLEAGNDLVFAGEGSNTIVMGTGNDTVYAGEGDDLVFAGEGDDLIFVGEGNNVIDLSGAGNDTVYGGSGSDRFVLGLGDGAATLICYGESDRISLGSGLTVNDITMSTLNGDTLLTDTASGDLLATLKWVAPSTVTFA